MTPSRLLYCAFLGAFALLGAEHPVRLHPENSHYFSYKGKPTVLITSGEHYGSLLNLRFDYRKYLDELTRNGFNLTRTFSGTYRELGTGGHGASPLSPGRGPSEFIAPWSWSEREGGFEGRRFNLDQWNPAYFRRLKEFTKAAHQRGIVVELVLFCRMYSDELWRASPFHPDNNDQGEEWRGLDHRQFLTLVNQALVARQLAVVRKIVSELKDQPNVYFEIANEPLHDRPGSEAANATDRWHEAMIDEIVKTESPLPAPLRHLIAYNRHYDSDGGFGPIPRASAVSVINFHYLNRMPGALAAYPLGKAIGFDETRWVVHPKHPAYTNTMPNDAGRVEAWQFLTSGGSVYSNLNYAYQVDNPAGLSEGSHEVKSYLKNLHTFFKDFDFVRMKPNGGVVAGGLPPGAAIWSALSESGRQYMIYIHHSNFAGGRQSRYQVDQQERQITLKLRLPAGRYSVDWVRPEDLRVLQTQRLSATDAEVALQPSPVYRSDIAIRIRSN
jgi:hypothetical protein